MFFSCKFSGRQSCKLVQTKIMATKLTKALSSFGPTFKCFWLLYLLRCKWIFIGGHEAFAKQVRRLHLHFFYCWLGWNGFGFSGCFQQCSKMFRANFFTNNKVLRHKLNDWLTWKATVFRNKLHAITTPKSKWRKLFSSLGKIWYICLWCLPKKICLFATCS